MDRVEKLLRYANLDGEGLEIGPLGNALVRRDSGRRIFYADYAPRDVLVAKSASDPHVDCSRIPEIDFIVENTSAYSRIDRRFDYVLASHVIEHTPDMLGWLQAVLRLIKPGGRLVLAIPDRRYMFDYWRPESTLGDLLEAYYEKRAKPSFRQVMDGAGLARRITPDQLWSENRPTSADPVFKLEVAHKLAKAVLEQGAYTDCHCWVFTYDSFLELMRLVGELGVIRVDIIASDPPVHNSNEFHVIMAAPD